MDHRRQAKNIHIFHDPGFNTLLIPQGAFHEVNQEDLRREIELLLGIAAYSLLPWRSAAT